MPGVLLVLCLSRIVSTNVHLAPFGRSSGMGSMHVHIAAVLVRWVLLAYLHHTINQSLIILVLCISTVACRATWNKILFPLSVFLRDESHW